jgi:ADP-ribose pyrophosphatase YjhB (NUDIX family)
MSLFLVTVSAWIKKWNKYLLHQRSLTDKTRPGERSIPWGKLEPNRWPQGLEKNLANEIAEEVGIKVKNSKLIANEIRMSFSGTTNRARLMYHCERKSWTAQALDDTNAVQWVTIDELKKFKPTNELLKQDTKALVKYIVQK